MFVCFCKLCPIDDICCVDLFTGPSHPSHPPGVDRMNTFVFGGETETGETFGETFAVSAHNFV